MAVQNSRRWGPDLRRAAVTALCLLSAFAVRAEAARDTRSSEHGLSFEKNATVASPSALAFFRGGEVALPEAVRNATTEETIWGVAGRRVTPAATDGGGRTALLLTAAVVCGIVGAALLAAAAVVYLVQARRADVRTRSRTGVVTSD